MNFLATVAVLLCLLAGCVGDQANRQGSTFRDLRVDAAGAERWDRAQDVETGAGNDPVLRSSLDRVEARQDATQQSMTGLGAQVREIRADVESLAKITVALHSDIKTEIRNELRLSSVVDAAASAELEARIETRLDVSTRVEALTSAVATLSANVETLAQAQASAQVGIGNEMRSTISELKANAGRDVNSTQFTQEMAGVYERFIGSFVWGLLIAAVVGIAAIAGAAYVLVQSKEHSRQRADSRERELRSAIVGAVASDRGHPARPKNGLPGRLDDEEPIAPEEVPW